MNEQEKNALELARADLWFLINHCEIPDQYIWRCGATAEYISKVLDDKASFEPTLQRWITEYSEFPDQRDAIINFLNKTRSRSVAR